MEGENYESHKEKKKKKRKRIDVKMEILREHPDKIAPLVGYFPSGFDPNKETEPEVKVFRNKQRPNRLQLVVTPNSSKVDFVGTSYSGEAAAAQVCTYALGILDKESQSLKIVPIASNKIFRLEPRVGGIDVLDMEPSKELKEEDLTKEQRADKIRELTNLYGTKRSIVQANKLESMQQREHASTQKDLEKKFEGAVINKEALESATDYTARNIPPHDSTATAPEKAYPLDKIIFAGEWDYLLDVLELIQSGAEITADAYPSFICNRVHKLEEIQDKEEKQQLACIFSYINHLLKFLERRSSDKNQAMFHKFPSIIYQKFMAMFTDSELFRLSAEKNDLLIGYILVLTLFADGFKTDLSDIARDLKMTPLSLRVHYEHLGCKLSRVDGVLMVTLPVPLQFPKLRRRRLR